MTLHLGSVEFGGSADATGLLDFVDAGHDLLLAVDPDASDELRELAADLGVDFDAKASVMTDHFNRYDQQVSGIVTTNALQSKVVFGDGYKHVSQHNHTSFVLHTFVSVSITLTLPLCITGSYCIQRNWSFNFSQKHNGGRFVTFTPLLSKSALVHIIWLNGDKAGHKELQCA